MNKLDKGMIHILGEMQWDEVRFHHAIQNSVQFNTGKFFTSATFHLISSGHG